MTKADFLAGKPFKFGCGEYKYVDSGEDILSIDGGFVYNNKFNPMRYEIWVEKVGTKSVIGYRWVMNKKLKLKISFEEMKMIEGLE